MRERGRPTNLAYEDAWRRIQQGMGEDEAYKLYLQDAGIKAPDAEVRKNFKAVMKYRKDRDERLLHPNRPDYVIKDR